MPTRAAVAATVLVLLAAPAGAQERVTLEGAIQEALARNRSLAAVRASAAEAGERASEARAGFFPRGSFSESWQRGNAPVFVFGSLLSARRFTAENFALDALNHPDPTAFFRGVLAVEEVVFDGGRTRAAVRGAAAGRTMAAAAVDEAEAALVLRVTDIYGRLLAAESARRTAHAAVGAAVEDVARAERRRDAGVASEADVLSLAVHLADVRQRAIQATGDAATSRAELNRLLGAPIIRDVTVAEPPPPPRDTAAADLAALLAEAEHERPELRRSAAAIDVAEAGARRARAGWWPQLAAQGAYQVDGTRFRDRASAWIVGGELRWSWSTGGAQLAGVRASAHAVERARAERDDAVAAVHAEVVSAIHRREAAVASETVARAAVEQARESERILRDRYDAGLSGVADVLRASTAVLDAETRRVSALVARIQADAAVRRALGRDPR